MVKSPGAGVKRFTPAMLSCEKDLEQILKMLFVEGGPYSDTLKKLLVINTADCLESKKAIYEQKVADTTLATLIQDGYVRYKYKFELGEHDDVKSYITFAFNDFGKTKNPEFRDCDIVITVLCHSDSFTLNNFKIRPLKIVGYIDGILNKSRLSGVGMLEFSSCNEFVISDEFAGYIMRYRAVHGSDDRIEG